MEKDSENEEISVLNFIGQNPVGEMITISTNDGIQNHVFLQKISKSVSQTLILDPLYRVISANMCDM